MIEGFIAVTVGVLAYCATQILKLKKENQDLKVMLIQQKFSPPAQNDAIKEDFLKFVSDSRDWAFQYIEEVQEGLKEFVSKVDPVIAYFDKFGDVLSNQRPDYEAMKTISVAYKDLVKVLPEDQNAKD